MSYLPHLSGLPPGFQVTNELLNAERPGLPPPTVINYAEKHVRIRRKCIDGSYILEFQFMYFSIQCPLDMATLDIAASLPIATSNPMMNLSQSINSDLGYTDLKYQLPTACGIVIKRVKFLLLFLFLGHFTPQITTLTTSTSPITSTTI